VSEFFTGWRRKLGCVTLLVGYVFSMRWVRSLSIEDEEYFELRNPRPVCLCSTKGHIAWLSFRNLNWDEMEQSAPAHWYSSYFAPKLGNFEPNPLFDNPEFTWQWWICAVAKDVFPQRGLTLFVILYRSIVVPLTLISLWLLLTKPRHSIQKKPTELSPEQVA
jgi:hypothetical protein